MNNQERIKGMQMNQIVFDEENKLYQFSFLPSMLLKYGKLKTRKTGGGGLNQPLALFLDGGVEVDKLIRCVQRIVDEEEALHSYVIEKDDKFFIKVKDNYKFHLNQIKVQGDTREQRQENAMALASKDAAKFIDIFSEEGSVFDLTLYEIDEDLHLILLIGNHVYFDTSTLMVMLWNIFKYYEDEDYVREFSEPYKNFMLEEMEFFKSDKAVEQIAYWEKEFEDYEPLRFDLDEKRKVEMSSIVAKFSLDEERLNKVAKENKTSIFNTMMLIFHMAIARIHKTNDTLTQYAISNRANTKYSNTIGYIARTIDNRFKFEDEDTITQLHRKMRKKMGEGFKNYQVCQATFGQVAHVIAYEQMGTSAPDLVFNGKKTRIIPIDVTRESFDFICIMIMEGHGKEMEIYMESDTQFVSRDYLIQMREASLLAEKFLVEHPDRTFSDYMRSDLTLENIDMYDFDDNDVDFISI